MTKPREIGLLFTDENLRLVAQGRKIQTRRLMKPHPKMWDLIGQRKKAWAFKLKDGRYQDIECDGKGRVAACCPYGNPQVNPVRYYLKEAVRVTALWDSRESNTEHGMALIQYPNDISDDIIECQQHKVLLAPGDLHKLVSRRNWRETSTPLFMLKSFARHWVDGVRTWPERLGDMSAEDAIAEGIECDPLLAETNPVAYHFAALGPHLLHTTKCWRDYLNGGYDLSPVQSYASLWNSINGKSHPWDADLWTWAVEWLPPAVVGEALS